MKHKLLKKLLSLILVAAMLLQIAPTALKAEASDAVAALTEGELEMEPQTGMSMIYEYYPFDVGAAGTINVNLYLETIFINRSDFSLEGERMPATVNFYYDEHNSFENNPYGAGWNNIYNQQVRYDSDTEKYAYKDENGTWISFVNSGEYDETGREIWKEDTLYGIGEVGLEMYRDTEVEGYTAITIAYGDLYYTFDGMGRLSKLTSGLNEISITYVSDTSEAIATITDPVGRSYVFEYVDGYLSNIYAKSSGGSTLYTLTYTMADGYLTQISYPDDTTVSYAYDETNRVSRITNFDKCGYEITYDDSAIYVLKKAAMGTEEEAEGSVTSIVWLAGNEVVISEDLTRYIYTFDDCGRVTGCELQTINSEVVALSIASSNYQVIYGYTMTYDYVSEEDGTITNTVVDVHAYDADGVIEEEETEDIEETEEESESTQAEYFSITDQYGNVVRDGYTIGGLEQATEYTYSEDGNYLTSVTDENGNTQEYGYNATTGLLTSFTDGNGNTTKYSYNTARNLYYMSLAVKGQQKWNTNTGMITPALANDYSGMRVRYVYSNGRAVGFYYGNVAYGFRYDIWGNLTGVGMGDRLLVSYDYGDDASKGQIESITYGNNQKVFYTYNSLGMISTMGYTGQLNRFTYYYKPDGALDRIYDAALDKTMTYSENGYEIYEGEDVLLTELIYNYSVSDDGNSSLEQIYDTVIGYQTETEDDVSTQSVYVNSEETYRISTVYDVFYRLQEKTVSVGNVNLTQNYGYHGTSDGTGSLVTEYEVSYNQGNFSYHYEYDGNGNIINFYGEECATNTWGAKTNKQYTNHYEYDAAGQLKVAGDGETGHLYEFYYDLYGNLMRMDTYEIGADGSITLVKQRSLIYDGMELIQTIDTVDGIERYTLDSMGNPVVIVKNGVQTRLTWGEGRMLKTINTIGVGMSQYTYNEEGLRTKKLVNTTSSKVTTEYIWGNNGLAGYKTSDGHEVIVIYGADGEPIGFMLDGAEYVYVKNLQGDVIRVLDAYGNTMVSYTYDPWGVPTVTGNETIAALNPCSYRCYEYDEETGYYYLQSRYYNPENGRFLNADDTAFIGSSNSFVSANIFAYCNNSPVMMSDPDGHFAIALAAGVVITVEVVVLYFAILAGLVALCLLIDMLVKLMPKLVRKIEQLIQNLVKTIENSIVKARAKGKSKKTNEHHIIARTAGAMETSRNIWTRTYRQDINAKENMVTLKETLHWFLHTKTYYGSVDGMVVLAKDKAGFIGVLYVLHFVKKLLGIANNLC